MISLKKESLKEMSDRQLSSNEIEKVLELQNSTLLRRLPGFGFPDFGLGHGLGLHSEDSDVTIFSNQKNVEGMIKQQKMIQNLLKHYHKNLVSDNTWMNMKNLDVKNKKRFSMSDLDNTDKRGDVEKPVKENIPMEEVKNKLKLKKDEDGKVFSKQRKTNFTSKEVETLLDCVRKKKEVILFGVAGGRGWAKAWQDIAKVVTKVEGIPRSEGDVRKKWTYLKWEAKNTSKPGRDPVSKQVLNILTSRDREVQEAMNMRNMDFPEDARQIVNMQTSDGDLKKMQRKFLASLEGSNYNSFLMTKEKYDSIIEDVKRIKGSNKKETSRDYRIMQKYDVLTVEGCEKLTEPVAFAKDTLKKYVHADELFSILYTTHISMGHGGRDRMIKHLNSLYKNITQGQIKLFLELCEVCRILRRQNRKKRPIMPPANSVQAQQQSTPHSSPQSQPQPSPPPTISQKKSNLPPLAPKPAPGPKLPQQSPGPSSTIKQLPKLLPKPQSPPEVCLRWNSYHSNMQNTFPSLLNNEQFVDVTLACDGRSIKCHKVMLSACSPYMEELLSSNPCQHPIIFLKDMKFWQLQALIDFMYRGEVNVTQDKLPSLLSAAEALQIKGLASPVNHSAPPKITQIQPMPSTQHDIPEEMDQVTYMRHLQLQTDIKNEYDDEYMPDTDESPPPTPKAKKRKTTHTVSQSSGNSNGTGGGSSATNQTKPIIVNKPKRDKDRHSEPSTSHQISNTTTQALSNQHTSTTSGMEHRRKSDNDKMGTGTDSENEYKSYSEDNRHSTQDDDLDLEEDHAEIILERFSSQNDDYSRGGDGDGDGGGDIDDNSTTSG